MVLGFGSVYMKLWGTLCAMAREPHPQLAQMAADIIAYVSNQVHYTILQYVRNYNKNMAHILSSTLSKRWLEEMAVLAINQSIPLIFSFFIVLV